MESKISKGTSIQCIRRLAAEGIARAAITAAGGPGLVGVEGVVSTAVKALA